MGGLTQNPRIWSLNLTLLFRVDYNINGCNRGRLLRTTWIHLTGLTGVLTVDQDSNVTRTCPWPRGPLWEKFRHLRVQVLQLTVIEYIKPLYKLPIYRIWHLWRFKQNSRHSLDQKAAFRFSRILSDVPILLLSLTMFALRWRFERSLETHLPSGE